MIWNFFATSHGKGKVDGTRALSKREGRKKQIKPQGQTLYNVKEKICKFLTIERNKYRVAHPNAWRHVNKFFWNVKVG
jgi:hypothetical protein